MAITLNSIRRTVVRSTMFALIALPGPLSLSTRAAHRAASPPDVHAQMKPTSIFSDADAEIRQTLQTAGLEHKGAIVDFGADWCADCRILNLYFHDARNAPILKKNYALVDVNVGMCDKNLNIARNYGVPLKKETPALVVLNRTGQVVYAQQHGEFEKMRKLRFQRRNGIPGDMEAGCARAVERPKSYYERICGKEWSCNCAHECPFILGRYIA